MLSKDVGDDHKGETPQLSNRALTWKPPLQEITSINNDITNLIITTTYNIPVFDMDTDILVPIELLMEINDDN